MKKEIKTEIIITATPSKVWDILLNFEAYPSWNPFIQTIKGNPEVNNTIQVTIAPPEGSNMTFKPIILENETNRKLVWEGKLFIRGFFDGKHRFDLFENEEGTTSFVHSEEFSGLLVGLFNLEKTKQGFVLMNESLKNRAESD